MSAGAIGGTSAALTATPQGFGSISSGDFIRLIITELTNQDPFAPQDSAALLEQISSLRNIESQLSLQQQIESLVLQNQVTAAAGLIGRLVSGLDQNNTHVNGLVTSVRVQGGKAILELDSGAALPIDRVSQISNLEQIG